MTLLNGIDVASYQAGIGKVEGDFRIVKVTEGTSYVNPYWKEQLDTAPELIGLYHFASNTDAKSEAKFFIDNIKDYIGKAILVLDYEPTSPNPNWAKTFLDEVYSLTGVRPLIYLGLSVENSYDWSAVAKANYGLWVAQYNNYNPVYGFQPRDLYGEIKHWKSMAMFQYTSTGRLSGWDGNLDFDVFYGDKDAWLAYAKSSNANNSNSTPSEPTKKVDVVYSLHQKDGDWLPDVKNFSDGDDGYAGMPNKSHDMLYIKVSHGSIKYRVHTIQDGWLDWVSKGDKSDTVNGVAGVKDHVIDGVQMIYNTPKGEPYQQAYYRSQTAKRTGWLGTCADNGTVAGFDSWAGMYGEPLDRLQISINDHSDF